MGILTMDEREMLETVKSSFLFNFRTGNVMIDTCVTGLIIMFTTYIFNMIQKSMSGGWDLMTLVNWYNWNRKATAKIVISGKKLQGADSTRLEYSTNFFAVLHQIKKLDCISSEIHQLSEIPIQEPGDVDYSYDDDSDDEDSEDGKDKVTSRGP